MINQAEQIRKRLEARAAGQPVPPAPPPPPAPAFQPTPAPVSPPPVAKVTLVGPQQVEVVNVNISFWHMVILMVKAAFAAIPALIIIAAILAVATPFLMGIIKGLAN